MLRLIINADDFGLCPGVNAGIIKAMSDGVVTSTSIMGNMPDLLQACAQLRNMPQVGLGVHLTLSAGAPLLSPSVVPSLVDQEGKFRRRPHMAVRNSVASEVEQEWRAQVERVMSCGVRPTHLDSHHHVHLAPALMRIVVKLAHDFAIPCIRRVTLRDVWRAAQPWQYAGLMPGVALSQRIAARSGLRFVHGVLPLHAGLIETLKGVTPGVYEVFCHPGYVDDTLVKISSLREEREQELALLVSPQFRSALAGMRASLITYRELL